jgi:hypothetical protein
MPTIKNGYAANADDVLSFFSVTMCQNITDALNNSRQTMSGSYVLTSPYQLYVAKDINDDMDTTVLNLEIASGANPTCINASGAFWSATNKEFYSGELYDFYDSVVDANKWTASGLGADVETTGYTGRSYTGNLAGSVTVDGYGTTTYCNLKPASGTDAECYMHVRWDSSSAAGASNNYLYLRDNLGNSIQLYTENFDVYNKNYLFRLVFRSGNNVDIYKNGVFDSTQSTAALTGTSWYPRLVANKGAGGFGGYAGAYFYPIVFVRNAALSVDRIYQSTVQTATATANYGLAYFKWTTGEANATHSMCLDGSTFCTVTNKQINNAITPTGTSIKRKVAFGTTAVTAIPKFTENGMAWI